MVERKRFLYWKVAFGHRNGSECIGYIPEYRRGYRNPPGKDMGLMSHRREANQPTRGWCAPTREEAELDLGRGRHPPFLLLLPLLPLFPLW